MKINIASTHRFHLLDLARELSRLGHDVAFYSYVPSKRCQKFGLPKECSRSMLPLALPFFVLQKVFGNKPWITKYRNILLDNYLSYFMRPCDLYIGLGTAYLKSFKMAKKRFNAITILEWGSKHVDEQQRILKEIGAPTNIEYFNQRSREDYEVVDYISIATQHVLESFLKHGFKREKFLVNPYGVDLSMFSYIPHEKIYDVIMVGNWSYQKGCDLIIDAIKHSDYKFLHVGSIVDCPFPTEDKRFTHVDAVDQPKLNVYYNKAKVFVLPSRQEGLAMVQAQAIACHLPLIGSKDSGAVDLQQMVDEPNYITIIKEHTWQAVLDGIKKSLKDYESLSLKGYAGKAVNNLTWTAYGERYERFVKLLESKNLNIVGG